MNLDSYLRSCWYDKVVIICNMKVEHNTTSNNLNGIHLSQIIYHLKKYIYIYKICVYIYKLFNGVPDQTSPYLRVLLSTYI